MTTSINNDIKALKEMITIRQNQNIFGDATTLFLDAPNSHCFAFVASLWSEVWESSDGTSTDKRKAQVIIATSVNK